MGEKKSAYRAARAAASARGIRVISTGALRRAVLPVCGALLVVSSEPARAVELLSQENLKLNWDNTVKFTTLTRVNDPSGKMTSDINRDDGDRNFSQGIISTRFDLLSQIDLTVENFGLRVSGAAWYDPKYKQRNDNDSPGTYNPYSVSSPAFARDVQDLHGGMAEVLDAYVFSKFELGNRTGVVRVGKHTLVFGETLFFGANGLAAAQAPIDAIKALSVPNTRFQELLMPVPQVSAQLMLARGWTATGYYQWSWKGTRIPGAGSYFSSTDMVGPGGQRLFVGPPLQPGGPMAAFFRIRDDKPRDSGQFGLTLRWQPEGHDVEYGFYAVQYHDKTPQLYLIPGDSIDPAAGRVGSYQQVYAENIGAYGISAATVIQDASVAAELSYRTNAPLVGEPAVLPRVGAFDNNDNPGYARGDTLHFNLSVIRTFGGSKLYENASLAAELGWNRVIDVTDNEQLIDPETTKSALGARGLLTFSYYQVFDGVDIDVPVGLGYNIDGKSRAVSNFNGGGEHTGDVSVGLKATYRNGPKLTVNFTKYLGDSDKFEQALKDRSFVSVALEYTF